MRFYKPQKGASLPSLTEPATEQDIVLGTQAINKNGEKLEGKLYIGQVHTQGGASIALVTDDEAGVTNPRRTLVLAKSIGNATAADILQGKTALTDAGEVTGTLEVTGGEPSYTLQIKTENSSDGIDRITYYPPDSSSKTGLALTTSYKSLTCGNFIFLYRGSTNNVTEGIQFLDDNDTLMLTVDLDTNLNYVVDLVANGGFCIINIGAVMRDIPTVSKISLRYNS